MSKIDDGGPAYPQHDLSGYGMGPSMRGEPWTDFDNPPEDARYTVEGMSLRDWIAGHALGAIIQAAGIPYAEKDAKEHARIAYANADAMLAARKTGGAS